MRLNEIKRIIAYASSRFLSLFITSVIAVYLTIVIANMGGYVDEMIKGGIEEGIGIMLKGGWLKDEPLEERAKLIEEARLAMYKAQGLDQPFLLRTFLWLKNGITLDFGEARLMNTSRYGLDSSLVKDIILDNLPRTLLLFTTSNIFLFLISISIALTLSRQYGTWLDKFFVVLSPLSSAPPWFYGIFLIVFFAFQLRILPSGGMYGNDPSATQQYGSALVVLRHMILPVGAIFLSSFFQSVYSWRTFFLIYAEDDYVEMARARGLPKYKIEQNYLLRPALPNLLTSFSLLLISSWSGSMLLELVFR
ncbi:MAG TPA: ABC transporter permease, partial [Anaerolineales bacterium]|nr:ABC transporter permease [Anaerolineales bacterium]